MANFIDFKSISIDYTKGLVDTIKKFGEDIETGFKNLKTSFEKVTYNFESPKQSWDEIAKILTTTPIKKTVVSEAETVEKDKNRIAPLPVVKYKFLVYNDTSFYRVFDILIGPSYPVKITGFNPNIFGEKEIECVNENAVVEKLQIMLTSPLVIDILERLDNQKNQK